MTTIQRVKWRCHTCRSRRSALVRTDHTSEGREFAATCACGTVRWFRIESGRIRAEAA